MPDIALNTEQARRAAELFNAGFPYLSDNDPDGKVRLSKAQEMLRMAFESILDVDDPAGIGDD
jgi:hypothetical protein